MSRVIWSPSALLDIQRLYRFLAKINIGAAQQTVKVIRERVKILTKQPEVGRPIDDMDPEYREWPINFGDTGYIALYHYDGKIVLIVAVRHQKEVAYRE